MQAFLLGALSASRDNWGGSRSGSRKSNRTWSRASCRACLCNGERTSASRRRNSRHGRSDGERLYRSWSGGLGANRDTGAGNGARSGASNRSSSHNWLSIFHNRLIRDGSKRREVSDRLAAGLFLHWLVFLYALTTADPHPDTLSLPFILSVGT